MEPDEHLYEAAAKELASSPRTGLLAKCMAKCGGDENKAKARYIEVRVGEMKGAIKAEAKRRDEEKRQAEVHGSYSHPSTEEGTLSAIIVVTVTILMIMLLIGLSYAYG